MNESFLDLVFKMPVVISDRAMLRIAKLVRRRGCEIKGIVIHDGLIQVVASHSKTARTVVLSFDRDGNVKGSESFSVRIESFSSFVHSDCSDCIEDVEEGEKDSGCKTERGQHYNPPSDRGVSKPDAILPVAQQVAELRSSAHQI